MLVNSKQILLEAKAKGFAVPSANFIDLESARAHVKTAEALGLPLFLSFAQSHREVMSLEEAAVIGGYLAKEAIVPVVLHLDHGEDFDYIRRAIDLGFKSVMIDASQQSFEDNVALTTQVVEYAHQFDVTVEAELGHVGANDQSESDELTDSIYTEVSDVVRFVEATNVDSLAVSIGTAHGVYKGEPKLSFDRLEEINNMTSIPLVLHGGSSTGDTNLNRCATSGIAKINIYSDFINGAYAAINEAAEADYVAMKAIAGKRMRDILRHYFGVFETKPVTIHQDKEGEES